ncbi:chitinase [Artemisia annua]|uniref:Chitinase n=1 Tax=Artemisia annua TaxID=35608 RepID=A0A2U1M6M2_ARTAN|nr:chitinase [Artemisia annua]
MLEFEGVYFTNKIIDCTNLTYVYFDQAAYNIQLMLIMVLELLPLSLPDLLLRHHLIHLCGEATRWSPSAVDRSTGCFSGYGVITNIINGGLECGKELLPLSLPDLLLRHHLIHLCGEATRWSPSAVDRSTGHFSGYGVITNIINGGLECGKG